MSSCFYLFIQSWTIGILQPENVCGMNSSRMDKNQKVCLCIFTWWKVVHRISVMSVSCLTVLCHADNTNMSTIIGNETSVWNLIQMSIRTIGQSCFSIVSFQWFAVKIIATWIIHFLPEICEQVMYANISNFVSIF